MKGAAGQETERTERMGAGIQDFRRGSEPEHRISREEIRLSGRFDEIALRGQVGRMDRGEPDQGETR
ncbi:hypothetical protein [Methanoculleus horonobensis]|jgi:hypothetical protein|uniref:hypothetical protein n=1 Tax=Methanoculleus horonobensis TaxID=528314 RepID=UPI00129048BE|nr:hypothetical protein [Methanoculleus horonobensis]